MSSEEPVKRTRIIKRTRIKGDSEPLKKLLKLCNGNAEEAGLLVGCSGTNVRDSIKNDEPTMMLEFAARYALSKIEKSALDKNVTLLISAPKQHADMFKTMAGSLDCTAVDITGVLDN